MDITWDSTTVQTRKDSLTPAKVFRHMKEDMFWDRSFGKLQAM